MISVRNVVSDRYLPPAGTVVSADHMESFRNYFNPPRSAASPTCKRITNNHSSSNLCMYRVSDILNDFVSLNRHHHSSHFENEETEAEKGE